MLLTFLLISFAVGTLWFVFSFSVALLVAILVLLEDEGVFALVVLVVVVVVVVVVAVVALAVGSREVEEGTWSLASLFPFPGVAESLFLPPFVVYPL